MPKIFGDLLNLGSLVERHSRVFLEPHRQADHLLLQCADLRHMTDHHGGDCDLGPAKEDRRSWYTRDAATLELAYEILDRLRSLGRGTADCLDTLMPSGHYDEDQCPQQERCPAAFANLQKIGCEECQVEEQEGAARSN